MYMNLHIYIYTYTHTDIYIYIFICTWKILPLTELIKSSARFAGASGGSFGRCTAGIGPCLLSLAIAFRSLRSSCLDVCVPIVGCERIWVVSVWVSRWLQTM